MNKSKMYNIKEQFDQSSGSRMTTVLSIGLLEICIHSWGIRDVLRFWRRGGRF